LPDRDGRKRRRVAGLGIAGAVIGAAAAIAGCGGSSHPTGTTPAPNPATATATAPQATASTGPRTGGGTTTATAAPQINLSSPSGNTAMAAVAEVVKQGDKSAIAIVGHGLAPNSKHDAYAVWLYNAPRDAVRLGFVNPGVGKNGHLATTGPLPTNASHFKQLVITIETNPDPQQPGQVVLRGKLTGV
jgi:hypothetical protein